MPCRVPGDWPPGQSQVSAGIVFPGELYDEDGLEFTVETNDGGTE